VLLEEPVREGGKLMWKGKSQLSLRSVKPLPPPLAAKEPASPALTGSVRGCGLPLGWRAMTSLGKVASLVVSNPPERGTC